MVWLQMAFSHPHWPLASCSTWASLCGLKLIRAPDGLKSRDRCWHTSWRSLQAWKCIVCLLFQVKGWLCRFFWRSPAWRIISIQALYLSALMRFSLNEMSLSPKAIFALISCLQANQLRHKRCVQSTRKRNYQIRGFKSECSLDRHFKGIFEVLRCNK